MLIGYARSTQDQNLDLQKRELEKIGCRKIYEDTVNGKQSDRPGLVMVLEVLRKDDTLVVWKLDRLGCGPKQLIALTEDLEKRGIHFRSLADSIDTHTTAGRFFFHVMGSLAEMERALIIERTRAGLKAAKEMGRTGGRKRLMTDSKIESAKKLLKSGMLAREVASNLGVSIPTLYRWIPAS
jgi:DNA invertase Pin-like site-specific DNA recombinase